MWASNHGSGGGGGGCGGGVGHENMCSSYFQSFSFGRGEVFNL